MSVQGIDQLLGELRSVSAKTGSSAASAPGEGVDFSSLLQSSIDQVNGAQQEADKLQAAFQAESPDANLQEVMVSLQKASLSFQTMVQVRNKLVTAYQEVMSMQV